MQNSHCRLEKRDVIPVQQLHFDHIMCGLLLEQKLHMIAISTAHSIWKVKFSVTWRKEKKGSKLRSEQ